MKKLSKLNEFLLIELFFTLLFANESVAIFLIRNTAIPSVLYIIIWLVIVAIIEITAIFYSIKISRLQHPNNEKALFSDYNVIIAALKSMYMLEYKCNDGSTHRIQKPYRGIIATSCVSHIVFIFFTVFNNFGTSNLEVSILVIAIASVFVHYFYMLLLFELSKLFREQL